MDPQNLEQKGTILTKSLLNEWNKNSKEVTKEGYDRTREQVEMLGQYKPLLVTQIDGKWIILGGHTRWKVYNELGIENLWCSVVEFFQDGDMWRAKVNGVVVTERFETREQGMATYSLSDNDESGFYVESQVKLNFTGLNIKHNFGISIAPPPTLEELLKVKEEGTGENDQEFEQEFQVVVNCKNEEEQQKIYDKLTADGIECKILTL